LSRDNRRIQTLSLLLDGTKAFVINPEIHGDCGGLDGDTALLFVRSCVSITCFTSSRQGDDSSFRYQRIGQGGFSVINYAPDVVSDMHIHKIKELNTPCAMTLMFLILFGLSISPRTWSGKQDIKNFGHGTSIKY